MSLLEALKDAPGSGRKIDRILNKVGNAEHEALTDALADPAEWPHSDLAEVLSTHGHPISEASVRRYRRDVLRNVL